MRGTQLRLRHLLGAAALSSSLIFGALTFASLPAGAQSAPAASTAAMSCPDLSVANPNPGDNLVPGAYIISGEAFDPAATTGSGISRVDLFLGLRDEGGTILGSAVPGEGTDNPRFFSVEVTVPEGFNRGTSFAAYALSSVSGQETTVSFPVFVGTPPKTTGLVTPTPLPAAATMTNTCAAGVAAPVAAAAPAAPAAAAPAAASTTGTSACPVLSLANPNPGDTVQAGDYFISGSVTDPAGVSRVDLFLGQRDEGGMFLGSATPGTGSSPNSFNIEVTVPNLQRGVDFAAYAIGANGQQTAVTFPVFVGSESVNRTGLATPTPVPTTESTTSSCM